MGATETVTVMFTDVVGSTTMFDGVGAEEADRRRRNHFSALRAGLNAHAGREIKNLGDGLMVVFRSTVAAVDAAVEMQQRVHRDVVAGEGALGLRIGVATGDADVDGDDFFGRPVVEAARLCAAAGAWADPRNGADRAAVRQPQWT